MGFIANNNQLKRNLVVNSRINKKTGDILLDLSHTLITKQMDGQVKVLMKGERNEED